MVSQCHCDNHLSYVYLIVNFIVNADTMHDLAILHLFAIAIMKKN